MVDTSLMHHLLQAVPWTASLLLVGDVDQEGKVADFSSRGGSRFPGKPDVAAPGVNIYSGTARASLVDAGDLDAGFGYAAISGTSVAAPHIAGLLALLKHRNPALTERDVKAILRSRGGPYNNESGWGGARMVMVQLRPGCHRPLARRAWGGPYCAKVRRYVGYYPCCGPLTLGVSSRIL